MRSSRPVSSSADFSSATAGLKDDIARQLFFRRATVNGKQNGCLVRLTLILFVAVAAIQFGSNWSFGAEREDPLTVPSFFVKAPENTARPRRVVSERTSGAEFAIATATPIPMAPPLPAPHFSSGPQPAPHSPHVYLRPIQVEPGHAVSAPVKSFSYGWFGVPPRQHWTRHFGYYRNYTQWSAK